MTITIYSTSTCGICHALMKWLDGQGQPYKSVEVDTDPEGMERLMADSGGMIGVPYTVVDKDDGSREQIAGFDQKKFKQILAEG